MHRKLCKRIMFTQSITYMLLLQFVIKYFLCVPTVITPLLQIQNINLFCSLPYMNKMIPNIITFIP